MRGLVRDATERIHAERNVRVRGRAARVHARAELVLERVWIARLLAVLCLIAVVILDRILGLLRHQVGERIVRSGLDATALADVDGGGHARHGVVDRARRVLEPASADRRPRMFDATPLMWRIASSIERSASAPALRAAVGSRLPRLLRLPRRPSTSVACSNSTRDSPPTRSDFCAGLSRVVRRHVVLDHLLGLLADLAPDVFAPLRRAPCAAAALSASSAASLSLDKKSMRWPAHSTCLTPVFSRPALGSIEWVLTGAAASYGSSVPPEICWLPRARTWSSTTRMGANGSAPKYLTSLISRRSVTSCGRFPQISLPGCPSGPAS